MKKKTQEYKIYPTSCSNSSVDIQIVVALSLHFGRTYAAMHTHTRTHAHTHPHPHTQKKHKTHNFAIMTFTNIHIFNRYNEIVVIKEHFYAGDASLIELYNLF
jgi:hypothetical protein